MTNNKMNNNYRNNDYNNDYRTTIYYDDSFDRQLTKENTSHDFSRPTEDARAYSKAKRTRQNILLSCAAFALVAAIAVGGMAAGGLFNQKPTTTTPTATVSARQRMRGRLCASPCAADPGPHGDGHRPRSSAPALLALISMQLPPLARLSWRRPPLLLGGYCLRFQEHFYKLQ